MNKFLNNEISGVLCVWQGCLVKKDQYDDFKAFIEGESKTPIEVIPLGQFESNVEICGDHGVGENSQDFFFEIRGDIGGIVIPRLSIGFKWFDDVVANNPDLQYLVNGEWVNAGEMVSDEILHLQSA